MDNEQVPSSDNLNIIEFQKMIFIYNALKDGWSVKMINNGKYEFKKSKSNIKKELLLEDYLKKFIEYNLNINNIL